MSGDVGVVGEEEAMGEKASEEVDGGGGRAATEKEENGHRIAAS